MPGGGGPPVSVAKEFNAADKGGEPVRPVKTLTVSDADDTRQLRYSGSVRARIETALGFDWTGHVAFLARHPTLSWWLALAYHSSGPQVGLVVIALSATRRLGRLWTYIRLFSATLLCVIGLAALLPALGGGESDDPLALAAAGAGKSFRFGTRLSGSLTDAGPGFFIPALAIVGAAAASAVALAAVLEFVAKRDAEYHAQVEREKNRYRAERDLLARQTIEEARLAHVGAPGQHHG